MSTVHARLTAPLTIAVHVPGRRFAYVPRTSQPDGIEPSGMPFSLEVGGIERVARLTLVRPPEPLNVTGAALKITWLLEPAGTQG